MNFNNEKNKNLGIKISQRQLTGYASVDKPWLQRYTVDQITDKLPYKTAYRYMFDNNQDRLLQPAINYFHYKISYKEMFRNIDICAKSLTKMGIKKGDIVPIVCANTPEIAYLFYALSKIGAVADIIDPRINENVLEKYIKDVDAKVLFCLDFRIPDYISMIKNKTQIKNIVTLPILESIPSALLSFKKAIDFFSKKGSQMPPVYEVPKNDIVISYKDFKKLGSNMPDYEEKYERNRPVAIIHTGGTTGIPKGAILSNDSLNALVHQLKNTNLEFNPGQTWLNLMPPCVAYGLANGLHLSLSRGMTTILIPTYEPEKIDDMILEYKPNRLTCSPAHWEYFDLSKKLKGKDLSFIINPIEGGDSINVELEKRINKQLKESNAKGRLNKGYGLSESCAALCVADPKVLDDTILLQSVGYPIPDTIISVFDPQTGKELKYNEIGEICALSPNLMLGYYNNEEDNAKTLVKHNDGNVWIHTGDLGYMTEDGRVFIKGRLKRIIIRFDGTKVYPRDIEDTIAKHYAVSNAIVVGVNDSNHEQGRLPKAYIVLKDEYKGNQEVLDEINRLCNEQLIDYMVPFAYEEINEVPHTKMGKPDFAYLESLQTETNPKIRKRQL